jgi:hypothetical protein
VLCVCVETLVRVCRPRRQLVARTRRMESRCVRVLCVCVYSHSHRSLSQRVDVAVLVPHLSGADLLRGGVEALLLRHL